MRFVKQFNDPVSLTMPFREEPYQSDYLFPFFTNMLPEGANRKIVCRSWRLDEKDFFGLLLKIATHDTIGAITVKEVESLKILSLPIHPCRWVFHLLSYSLLPPMT